jgi:hypothetical protein
VLLQSTSKVITPVKNPATGASVTLSDLSATGGVVNAYEAVKLADTLSGKKATPAKTRSILKKAKRA